MKSNNTKKFNRIRSIYSVGFLASLALFLFASCVQNEEKTNDKMNVVCTTTMITDLAKQIGGDLINVEGLMGAGVDPHLYKPSEGDVSTLINADIVFYNGLHLEGKLDDVFGKMGNSKKTVALGSCLTGNDLMESDLFTGNFDPHVWFSINNWKKVAKFFTESMKEADPNNASNYQSNFTSYMNDLNALSDFCNKEVQSLAKEKRILVTAHDAFGYFGREFDFEVVALQGLSTTTEAGIQDVQKLAAFIIEKDIKSIFVESSIPKRTIESLQAAVKSKGHDVGIGGSLYSDALGDAGSIEGTYIGMYNHNVKTIVGSLK